MCRYGPDGSPPASTRGFTLVELLVVLMIMLLIMGMVVPAIRAINGSRSVEVAYNEIASVLQRARLRAIGLAQETGIMFYLDPQTQLTSMTMVYTTPSLLGDPQTPPNPPPSPMVDHLVELVPNQPVETLPSGIGFQTVNTGYNQPGFGTNILYNGFIAVPNAPTTSPLVGGLVLFDTQGHVLKVPWGCRLTSSTTGIGQLLYSNGSQAQGLPASVAIPPLNTGGGGNAPISNFAFTLYDLDTYNTYGNQITKPNNSTQDPWLEKFGYEVLLNGYDGTLLKSE